MRQSDLPPEALSPRTRLASFEGGTIYTAELFEKFYVIIDESTMADLLSEDDLADLTLIKAFEFDTADERITYLA
jgi:hypothetical protein